MRTNNSTANRNLKLTIFESAITAGLISMSIMTPFFYSIGLNNAEIALSQALFTIVVSILNLPMGWLADRLGRKWANVIGNFGHALGFLFYATADNFIEVVFCECWLGVFLSISQGVDFTLLKHFSHQINPSEAFFRRQSAQLTFWQNVCTFALVLLGGPLGAINFRLAIALSGAPSFLGGVASLFIQDNSERLQPTYANPVRDLLRVIKYALQSPHLRTRLFAYAVGREMTHGIIWVLTPMLLYAGVPLAVVSVAWAIDSLMRILGTRFALRYAPRLEARQIFAIPVALMTVSMLVLSLRLNLWTIGLYLLMSIVCGWTGSTLMPLVQEKTPPAEQTTIISLAKVMGQVLYIPASLIIGWLADLQVRYAASATLIIFLPLSLIIIRHLQRE